MNAMAQEPILDLDNERAVRGIIAARNVASISVDTRAKVKHISFKIGDSFSKGDVLVEFDCGVLFAESAAAQAAFKAVKAEYESNLELQKNNAIGELDVILAKARMQEQENIWKASKARTNHCTIRAPFNGKVADLSVHAHEMSSPDAPLMKIVGNDHLELNFVVPSSWLAWLSSDMPFNFQIDETGKEYQAIVSRIGAEIDPISGTIDIFANFTDSSADIIPGMSGLARFPENNILADTE